MKRIQLPARASLTLYKLLVAEQEHPLPRASPTTHGLTARQESPPIPKLSAPRDGSFFLAHGVLAVVGARNAGRADHQPAGAQLRVELACPPSGVRVRRPLQPGRRVAVAVGCGGAGAEEGPRVPAGARVLHHRRARGLRPGDAAAQGRLPPAQPVPAPPGRRRRRVRVREAGQLRPVGAGVPRVWERARRRPGGRTRRPRAVRRRGGAPRRGRPAPGRRRLGLARHARRRGLPARDAGRWVFQAVTSCACLVRF